MLKPVPLYIIEYRSLLSKKILLLVLMFMLSVVMPRVSYSQQSTFNIIAPQLAWGQRSPILGRETAVVWANATSTFPVLNVTLHWIPTRKEGEPPESLDRYHAVPMNIVHGNKFNATYEAIMPQAENDTSIWGFAMAYDDHGNLAQSQNQRIYYAMTPNPKSTYLDMTFYVRHVDPKTMIMNMTLFAVFQNALSYSPEILRADYGGFNIPITKPTGNKYTYSNEVTSVDVFYSKGHPELYPFDGYNYTLAITVPLYLNESEMRFDGVPLKPNTVYVDFIGVQPGTLVQALDNSAWKFHSEIRYFPSANFTSRSPYIRFTVLLERRFEQINYLLLVPTLSLYALLGFSVLLRGREELRNRLLLYLNVFVFSYGFQSVLEVFR